MDFLSPAKLLVILVVAVVVLGPDKLPKVAKQVGSLWGDFRKFRARLETEVRGNFPDLPSTGTVSRAESSDVQGDAVQPSSGSNRPAGVVQAAEEVPVIPGLIISDTSGIVHQVRSSGGTVPDQPGLN